MSRSETNKVTIVGAGLGGSLMAVYLAQAGYAVEVFERRPDPRTGKVAAGRSINLALSTRGLHALGEVGLAEEILKIAIPMRGRMIHDPAGNLSFQPYDKDPSRAINSVSRAGLNQLLVETAEKHEGVSIRFDHRCEDVNLAAPRATLTNNESRETVHSAGDVVIGADGAFSAVRSRMQRLDRFDYSQSYLKHGYKELTIPPAEGKGPDDPDRFRMDPNALHIWPRRSFMMIALPNPDGSFTCTCFWPFTGPNGFDRLQTPEQVRAYFEQTFPDAVPLMPSLAEDYHSNPTSSLVTVRCHPWVFEGKVALLGDACHAIVPFYGQGMNAAFEDCTELNRCLLQCDGDWARALPEYDRRRKPNADAIADLALYNFIEMRDHSGTRRFRAKKAFQRVLQAVLPAGWYTPLYTMVTFTRIPYAETLERNERQNRAITGGILILGAVVLMVLAMLIG